MAAVVVSVPHETILMRNVLRVTDHIHLFKVRVLLDVIFIVFFGSREM
jgi:hypothetical protein